MLNLTNKVTVSKNAITKKTTTCKDKKSLLILISILLSSKLMVSLLYARGVASSNTDIIHVEPSSRESITKFLNIGDKITGEITVSGGDNYIVFKLYDPSGNPCLMQHVLQSSEFSWGPVNFDGEYLFVFDNWYDSSSRNTVNFEFQIISTLNNSFPTTTLLVIVVVLVAIIVSVAILLIRRFR